MSEKYIIASEDGRRYRVLIRHEAVIYDDAQKARGKTFVYRDLGSSFRELHHAVRLIDSLQYDEGKQS